MKTGIWIAIAAILAGLAVFTLTPCKSVNGVKVCYSCPPGDDGRVTDLRTIAGADAMILLEFIPARPEGKHLSVVGVYWPQSNCQLTTYR